MKKHDTTAYGSQIAGDYDSIFPSVDARIVDGLERLAAPGGRVLELGVGTGRIALPLAARGLTVHGVDSSSAMLEKLREKDGASTVTRHEGEIGDLDWLDEEPFDLIVAVFRFLPFLVTQEDQLRCLTGCRRLLKESGKLVLDLELPDSPAPRGAPALVRRVDETGLFLSGSEYDPFTQRAVTRHVHLTSEGIKMYSLETRYVWPSELDLMARIARLRLLHRWSDWDGRECSERTKEYISVYVRGD